MDGGREPGWLPTHPPGVQSRTRDSHPSSVGERRLPSPACGSATGASVQCQARHLASHQHAILGSFQRFLDERRGPASQRALAEGVAEGAANPLPSNTWILKVLLGQAGKVELVPGSQVQPGKLRTNT